MKTNEMLDEHVDRITRDILLSSIGKGESIAFAVLLTQSVLVRVSTVLLMEAGDERILDILFDGAKERVDEIRQPSQSQN